MSGAQRFLVEGLSLRIHSGMRSRTFPHLVHTRRSFEQRRGISPSWFGPAPVENTYQVSPALMSEGSCTNSVSPDTGMGSGMRGAWAATVKTADRKAIFRKACIRLRYTAEKKKTNEQKLSCSHWKSVLNGRSFQLFILYP